MKSSMTFIQSNRCKEIDIILCGGFLYECILALRCLTAPNSSANIGGGGVFNLNSLHMQLRTVAKTSSHIQMYHVPPY